MTRRHLTEWKGATPDTPAPPRVRVRVFDRENGRCGQCGRKIRPGDKWTLEHVQAIINGGENREGNLGVTCNWCVRGKNAADLAEKSKVYEKRAKHLGVNRRKSRPLTHPTLKKKVSGEVVTR